MENNKLNNGLKATFENFEETPDLGLFENIQARLAEHYVAEKKVSKKPYLILASLLFIAISYTTFFYSNQNVETNLKSEKASDLEKIESKNLAKKKIDKSNASNLKENNLQYIDNEDTKFNATAENLEKNIDLKLANKISNKNFKTENNNIKSKNTTYKLTENIDQKKYLIPNPKNKTFNNTFNETNIRNGKLDHEISSFGSNKPKDAINSESIDFQEINEKKSLLNSSSSIEKAEMSFKLISNKNVILANNNLLGKLPKLNIKPKTTKDLPKISKTTPLALEFTVDPFMAFQAIEPTVAGLANIQNINLKGISTSQRVGFALNANCVINWTKLSRLRLGLSYRDIFQKVGYEIGTDVYEFKTINENQTILVRKGLPYVEDKRNHMIGFKADRQFFLQMSTPTRIFAALGAEYCKVLGSKSQFLFVNSSMGFDFPINQKLRLQFEPSYSYALLGTTDANKNVNIHPSHIGLKAGLLFELRK